jgi:hypothetical protein
MEILLEPRNADRRNGNYPGYFSNTGPSNTAKGTHLFLKHQYATVTIRAMAIVRPSGELQCRRLSTSLITAGLLSPQAGNVAFAQSAVDITNSRRMDELVPRNHLQQINAR